ARQGMEAAPGGEGGTDARRAKPHQDVFHCAKYLDEHPGAESYTPNLEVGWTMDRTKLTQAELGAALGISQPMTSRLIALGMPDDSIEAARLWRKAHLDRSYTIDYRRTRHPRHA